MGLKAYFFLSSFYDLGLLFPSYPSFLSIPIPQSRLLQLMFISEAEEEIHEWYSASTLLRPFIEN